MPAISTLASPSRLSIAIDPEMSSTKISDTGSRGPSGRALAIPTLSSR